MKKFLQHLLPANANKLLTLILLFVAQTTVTLAQQQALKAASAADTTALFIKPNGNVGIGTANPVNKLQLGGNMHMDGHAIFFRLDPNDQNDFIKWSPENDKMDMGGYYGVRLGDTHAVFFPIMTIGHYKPTSTGFVPTVAVDIQAAPREPGNEPTTPFTMYVTGDMLTRQTGIQFRQTSGYQGIGFTMNAIYTAGSFAAQDLNLEVVGPGNLIFKTKDTKRMLINADGNVAMGFNNNPQHQLVLGGSLDMTGHAIYFQADQTDFHDFVKWIPSENQSKLKDRMQIAGWNGVDIGKVQNGYQTGLAVNETGFVGIGTEAPEMPLDVRGTRGSGQQYNAGGNAAHCIGWHGSTEIDATRTYGSCSIHADGDIVTNNVLVSTQSKQFSDIRLKKDIRPSSSAEDLATLKKITIVNYKMIDTVADDKAYKKVIAQQVQRVYPLAVSTTFRTLPDVFQHAIAVGKQTDSTYLITVAKPENLKAGDRLVLKCDPANDVNVMVIKIQDQKSFEVQSTTALGDQKSVFVYGHPADDVFAVDYDAISMLNVSATQQLAKIIDEQQKEIDQLKKQNADDEKQQQIEALKKQNADQSLVISAMLARLSKLEQEKTGGQAVLASVQK